MEGKTLKSSRFEKKRNFDYDRMDVGNLVAFRHEKLDTGMITSINRTKRLVKVETKLDRKFIVPFERIVWVKLDYESYWPTAVYNELKGGEPCKWEGTDFEPFKNKRKCKEVI